MKYTVKTRLILAISLLCSHFLQAQNGLEYQTLPGEGKLAYTISMDEKALAMSPSPEGEKFAFGADEFLVLVDYETGKKLAEYDLNDLAEAAGWENRIGNLRSLAWLPNGNIAVGCIGGLFLVDPDAGKILWGAIGHEGPDRGWGPSNSVYQVATWGSGEMLVTTSEDDHTLKFWSASDGSFQKEISTNMSYLSQLAVSPDGGHFAVQGDKGMILYNSSGEVLYQEERSVFQGPMVFTPSGKGLLAGTWGGGASVAMIDLAHPGDWTTRGPAGSRQLGGLALLPGDRWITAAAGTGLCPIHLWSADSETAVGTLEKNWEAQIDADNAIAVGKKGKMAAISGDGDEIKVFRID